VRSEQQEEEEGVALISFNCGNVPNAFIHSSRLARLLPFPRSRVTAGRGKFHYVNGATFFLSGFK